MRILIVNVASVALALKATGCIHTSAVGAHRRHQGALVDLFGVIRDRVHDLTRHQPAQNLVLTWQDRSVIPLNSLFLVSNGKTSLLLANQAIVVIILFRFASLPLPINGPIV